MQKTGTNILLQAKVLWSHHHEVKQRNALDNLAAHISFVMPYHAHKGSITLTDTELIIEGDENLRVPLTSLVQLYHGFDETFPPSLAKNLGLTWQPLRLSLNDGRVLYLIINYSLGMTKNKLWFEALKEVLD